MRPFLSTEIVVSILANPAFNDGKSVISSHPKLMFELAFKHSPPRTSRGPQYVLRFDNHSLWML